MTPQDIDKLQHESAVYHVTGEAIYVNDMPVSGLLHGHVVYSAHAHALIRKCDISEALKLPGVAAVLTHTDIPGMNQMGPIVHDEPCLAVDKVTFIGQAIALVAADTEDIARRAASLIRIDYEVLEPVLTIEDAIAKGNRLAPPRKMECGDFDAALADCPHVISGELKTGAQEHWYLETQACLAVCGEGKEMTVYSSTQNPTETQAIVAEVLGVQRNEVVCETRRMGGGFGGKETQSNHVAAWAALLSRHTGKPVKIHLFREDDQRITGKRHPFLSRYRAGFDENGLIKAYSVEFNSDAGAATDLSMAILERAMLHAENAYYLPNARIIGHAWKTNLPSNTAFRGFGGPQGIAVIETVIDRIARSLKTDSALIRQRNFYQHDHSNTTPYGQLVEHNRLFTICEQLVASSDYTERRRQADEFNRKHEFVKRGIALTPVKFGISFTTSFLNQAGALVNVYTDGTMLVNHGGTEMGQGLYTKMLAVAAAEMGLSPGRVKVNATNTSKVPNTSPTAASSGSDMNGMAVKNAITTLKKRLAPVAAEMLGTAPDAAELVYAGDTVYARNKPEQAIPFEKLVQQAHFRQISLSATGYYFTPNVHFDRERGKGRPFHYFAYGISVSEVEVDMLTGGVTQIRTDILHDVGNSLNSGIDKGQVEGAFIQGMGWCTGEEIRWDEKGRLLNVSPDTYKIPVIGDLPHVFHVKLLQNAPAENTIRSSKAVGEPPFMLAFSVWLAIKDAISAVNNHETEPPFSLPATNETILLSVEYLKKQPQG